ncbi:molybdate ABC transporter substrate-binding protein [Halomonas marinisediminis]|uniref:Molybdate ABC transporter substrate-binding protein n=1 Tax=Halomonas marinisediminis TaxID=2546095 RepID=A0ABY2D9D8_9GAMM|nr:molybdate ABC transporter substrate-binding protein [Halomonas marinisediminis]TDB01397.1 molybdate ABC transporter substrate-binding protein [Halomonas marinisediminis]
MRSLTRAGCRALLLGLTLLFSTVALARPPIVAAASSLQAVFPHLAEAFRAETGESLRVNFGSSGNFRRQIEQGAPFELFLSADEAYVLALHEAGHLADMGEVYAVGRLVWLQRKEEQGRLPSAEDPLAAVREAVASHAAGEGRSRIALANPEHAPYGVAARQALVQAGLWEPSAPLRVLGESVAQATRFALSADARGGLVAWSQALAPPVAARSEFVMVPADWHQPLVQRMALVKGAGDTARAFYAWLQREEARAILADYGFRAPGDGFRAPGDGLRLAEDEPR